MNRKVMELFIKKWSIWLLLLLCVVCGCLNLLRDRQRKEDRETEAKSRLSHFLTRQMELAYFVLPAYLEDKSGRKANGGMAEALFLKEFPVFQYAADKAEQEMQTEDELMAELLRRREGTDEENRNIDEESLDYGEDALHIEGRMLAEMERENSLHNNEIGETEKASKENLFNQESNIVFREAQEPAYAYDWTRAWDYEALVSNFYAVDASTSLKGEYLSLEKLLQKDLSVDKSVDGPQILIYHTHASEGFLDSVEGDASTTIVGAGEKLAGLLEEKYGFQVLHHTGVYDKDRASAYEKALPEIEKILEENPTIEVVIDLHRDEMSNGRKLLMDLQGRPTARFMFFNGMSYLRRSGEITYLENPYIQDNLALSFQAQVAANEYYPGIARKIYLKAYRFNMHLKPKCMLIELGAQNNTVEEISNACDPLAHVLAIVLNGQL